MAAPHPYPRMGLGDIGQPRHGGSSVSPFANPAAQALARVQPVPWVCRVSTRWPSSRVSPVGVTSTSTTVSPTMCPPFIKTAFAPRPSRKSPARRWPSRSTTSRPVRASASGAFGVSRRPRDHQRLDAEMRLPPAGFAALGHLTVATPADGATVQTCRDPLDHLARAQHAGLDGVGPVSSSTARAWPRSGPGSGWTPWTPVCSARDRGRPMRRTPLALPP